MTYFMRPLKYARNGLILFLSLLGLTLMMLFGSLWLALRSSLMPTEKRKAYIRLAITTGYRRYFAVLHFFYVLRLDMQSLDFLRGERGLILAANHPTLFDALLIISRLPNVVCIMKAQVLRNVMFGQGAKMAGYISNESIRHIVNGAAHELAAGSQLLLFPEGTRSQNGCLHPFQGTVGLIARRTGCAVQSIFIESDSGFLGKGWPFWKVPDFPVCIRVRIGQRFTAHDDSKQFIDVLERYYRQELDSKMVTSDGNAAPVLSRECAKK